jgi:ligand-binding sensor domain-containing protein
MQKIILAILLACFSWGLCGASDKEMHFEKFQYNDKLPSNSVIRIYNDREGYMWFGTSDGLCRFDGYDMKIFRSSATTPERLTNNEIQCIAEDNDNRLWVGTLEGINIIDKDNYGVTSLDNQYTGKERINYILPDSKGFVWVATSNGVVQINPATNASERFTDDENSRLRLRSSNVTCIYEDHCGRIWFSMWNEGLCCFDKNLKTVTNLPKIGNLNNPFRLYQDADGLFWICTWGDGVFVMKNNDDGQYEIWQPIPELSAK